MISSPRTPRCSPSCVVVIVLVILRRTSRCSCLNWLYWMLHFLCKNHCVTSHHLMWACLITSKLWVLNIQPIHILRVILCTKLDSGLMAGLILRHVYWMMSLKKTITHVISHRSINQGISSPHWSFTFSKSCNDSSNRYNTSTSRYNVFINRYNDFQKISDLSENWSIGGSKRYQRFVYRSTFQKVIPTIQGIVITIL
jgi:hypothetical protein